MSGKVRQLSVDVEVHERLKAAAAERLISPRILAHFLLVEGLDALIPFDEFKLTRRPKGGENMLNDPETTEGETPEAPQEEAPATTEGDTEETPTAE